MDISLTDFVEFAIKSGSPKLTKVSEIKNRAAYSPAFDFWKPLREGVRDFHETGTTDRSCLDQILLGLTDKAKQKRFPELIKAYKRFLGKKEINWFPPPTAVWSHVDLKVRVNPELGLEINGVKHVIKLYFKDEAPSKFKLQAILQLMQSSLDPKLAGVHELSVLDVASGKLISWTTDVSPLLKGEAAAFVQMWHAIP